jgi:hypothetical protein
MAELNEAAAHLQRQAVTGAALARGPWRKFLEGIPEEKKGLLAFLMENQKNWLESLDEETRVANIGSFEKFIFPMIKGVYPNLVATELVSVQPMQSPTSLIFFRDSRYGTSKGQIKAGDTLFSARTGWNEAAGFNYSSEIVEGEVLAQGDNTDETPFGNSPGVKAAFTVIRPGSLVITYLKHGTSTEATITDDGVGGLVGEAGELDSTPGANSVNYTTGYIMVTFASGKSPNTGPIAATYDYNSEGAGDLVPQVDVVLTSTPVMSRPRKLRARWSIEAAAQLKSVHGMEAETEIVTDMANEMRIEVDREIISDLLTIANANNTSGVVTETTFDKAAPTNVALYLHRQAFIYAIIEASNKIFKATRRHQANWLLCGINVANIIMGQEGAQFQSSGSVQGSGVQFIGTLNGLYKIFMDPYLDSDTAIIGYKGDSFLDAGYVYAPWIPFYATPTIYLDDFMGRKGLLTHYAKKPINGLFYGKVRLT